MAKAKATPKKSAPARSKAAPRAKVAVAPRPASAGGERGYAIICSECYSEFTFHPVADAQITCPDCLHVGHATAGDVLNKIRIAKDAERSRLRNALIPAILFVAVGLAWVFALTLAPDQLSDSVNYGFMGANAIILIVLMAMIFKYESSRNDVYF